MLCEARRALVLYNVCRQDAQRDLRNARARVVPRMKESIMRKRDSRSIRGVFQDTLEFYLNFQTLR